MRCMYATHPQLWKAVIESASPLVLVLGLCFWHVTYTQFSTGCLLYVTTIVVVLCGWWYIINKNMLGIFNLAAAFDWIELTSRTEQGADRMIVSLFKFQPSSHECKATTQTRTKSRSSSGWLIWISSRTLFSVVAADCSLLIETDCRV